MVRSCCKYIWSVAMASAVVICATSSGWALSLICPTEGQAVRENVKIQLSSSAVPEGGFISVRVGDAGSQKFVAAINRQQAKDSRGVLTFYWNSKAAYYDPSSPMEEKYFKDGTYALSVDVHGADGNLSDSATVNVSLRNKVPRTNPAPAVSLVNKLSFGQINTYDIKTDADVFDAVGLPVMGGLGLSGDFKVVLSVEDVRPDGQILLRQRIDEKAFVSSMGVKRTLYEDQQLKPQLYRMITKYGKVVKTNMFSKQANYSIMDIIPMLPKQAVREGDSWPDGFNLKLEGITQVIKLKGTARLDSFEWQDGRECVKIVAQLTGDSQIAIADGNIRSAGPIKADVTTYLAYKTGRLMRRNIDLSFPALILPGAADALANVDALASSASVDSSSPYSDSGPVAAAPRMMPPVPSNGVQNSGSSKGNGQQDTSIKKGTVRISAVVRLEK